MKAKTLTKETVLDFECVDRGFPEFSVGDKIEVFQIVKESVREGNKEKEKEREQKFEGNVITYRKNGAGTSFTVRKISTKGIGVERTFPYYSPIITKINKIKEGKVRRAKLYYLRDKVGKETKIKGH